MSRRVLLVAWLFVLAVAPGCQGEPGTSVTGSLIRKELVQDQRSRFYLSNEPEAVTGKQPYALVVMLHGGLGNPQRMADKTRFHETVAGQGVIVAYPAGSGRLSDRLLTWNAGYCCGYAQRKNIDDVGFIDAVIDDINARFPLDPQRIFVVGHSNGGMMAYRMACDRADRVDGIGAVAATMDYAQQQCRPRRPVTIVSIHGDADQNIPTNGGMGTKSRAGVSHRSVVETLRLWRDYNRCEPAAGYREIGQASMAVSNCQGGRKVVDIRVHEGPHQWDMAGKFDVNAALVRELGIVPAAAGSSKGLSDTASARP